jgi:hypothetical protein
MCIGNLTIVLREALDGLEIEMESRLKSGGPGADAVEFAPEKKGVLAGAVGEVGALEGEDFVAGIVGGVVACAADFRGRAAPDAVEAGLAGGADAADVESEGETEHSDTRICEETIICR